MIHPAISLVCTRVGKTNGFNYYLKWDAHFVYIGNIEKSSSTFRGVKNYRSNGASICIVHSENLDDVIEKLYELALIFTPSLQDLYQRYPVED